MFLAVIFLRLLQISLAAKSFIKSGIINGNTHILMADKKLLAVFETSVNQSVPKR